MPTIVKDGNLDERKAEARRIYLNKQNNYKKRTCDECGCVFVLTEIDLDVEPTYEAYSNVWKFSRHFLCPSCKSDYGWVSLGVSVDEDMKGESTQGFPKWGYLIIFSAIVALSFATASLVVFLS